MEIVSNCKHLDLFFISKRNSSNHVNLQFEDATVVF